jgi:hypothetical protein
MEPTGPTGTTVIIWGNSITGGTAAPPRISMSDILSDVLVLRRQETIDRAKFSVITSPDIQAFRSKLIVWAAGGFLGTCDLVCIQITAPNVCSDGVVRNFFDYIQFVSGKTYLEHMADIQAIVPEFQVGYRCSRNEFVITVCGIRDV